MNRYKVVQKKHVEYTRELEISAKDIIDAESKIPKHNKGWKQSFEDYSVSSINIIKEKEE